jgi:transcription antitermination factor NusG
MPILKVETSVFPPDLFDGRTEAEQHRKWWAVYTRSRQEKSLARQLEGMSVPFYLPLVRRASVSAGRRIESLCPLFSSYVFVFADDFERIATLSTHRVTQMLCAENTALMTKDLASIRSLISSGVDLNLESRVEVGQRVRVKRGVLMGMEGTVISRRGVERLLIAVEFLQQGVSIELSDIQVEPV